MRNGNSKRTAEATPRSLPDGRPTVRDTLPVTKWNYRDDPAAQHIGPVARDFRAAFGLGSDDEFIATVDPDGVALAAIQGLNRKVDEKDRELLDLVKRQQAQIEALRAELASLRSDRWS
jgi:trimeric autotransporter adhesin